ncbi:MAG: sigma-54-dependent Fis family transcriptional regulator [Zoogloeaceae bacterium]|nr:sigma-54-dependent Fis family transcriptional regulator [Zoogloeaceae bacterium]
MAALSRPSLLLVDDDPLICEAIGFVLASDFTVHPAASREEAIDLVRSGLEAVPELALIDLGLPPRPHRPDEGFALISELLALAPDMRILVLSGQNEEMHARHARALGALEFIAKPAHPIRVREALFAALSVKPEDPAKPALPLLGNSPAMVALRGQIQQFAATPFPVLIEGESGTGKERAAEWLHHSSPRRDHPFLTLNCAAMSPHLIESLLFGHARGAFTGATGQRAGYFEDAGAGTLFLDEIGELPVDLQPKLLRVLENGEYQRVGETQRRFSQARVIAATNRDLKTEVRAGRFRADLYHRLSVFSLRVPPLRDLAEDRFRLLSHFGGAVAGQLHTAPFALGKEAETLWRQYAFPGNVRELRNIVIRLQTKYPGSEVGRAELAAELDLASPAPLEQVLAPNAAAEAPTAAESRIRQAMLTLEQDAAFNLDATLRAQERAFVEAALRVAQGNVSHAARLLGLHRTTLYNRMEALGLPRPQVPANP